MIKSYLKSLVAFALVSLGLFFMGREFPVNPPVPVYFYYEKLFGVCLLISGMIPLMSVLRKFISGGDNER